MDKLCFCFPEQELDKADVFLTESRIQNNIDNRIERTVEPSEIRRRHMDARVEFCPAKKG